MKPMRVRIVSTLFVISFMGIFTPRLVGQDQDAPATAEELQAKINRVTNLMVQYENWSYRKAIMKYIGFDCGSCRAPYAPLSESEYEAFAIRLDELGVLARDEGISS